MTAATCREVQRAIARDGDGPELVAATSRHLRDCADCRARERARSRIRDGVLAANDDLDDLTRTRVLARLLEGRRQAGRQGAPARGARAWLGGTLAFSAILILAVTSVLRSQKPGAVSASFTPFVLEPYAVDGGVAPGSPALSTGGLDRVELPAHASMRARLGPAADFVLLGPLELAVREGDETRAAVELRRGTLVGDFDGSKGRRLRIVTADATVDIVGTRFLIEASSERTRVSVEHGRVRVESHGQVRLVGGQQEWSTDQASVVPLHATRASLFERTARGNLEELAPAPSSAAAVAMPPAAESSRPGTTAPRRVALAEPGRNTARSRRTEALPARARELEVRADAVRSVETPVAPVSNAPGTSQEALPSVAAPSVTPAPPVVVAAPPVASVAPITTRAPVAPEAKPRENAASLYHRAEAALRQGDDAAGKKLLDELVRAFPDQPATDSARYELALMAEKAGQTGDALAQTREILRAGAHGPFVEPAQFLRCRVYLTHDRGDATTCLTRFVRDFPRSPHDEVALRALIDLSRESGRCDDAKRFAETYLQRHPAGRFAGEANRARSQCGR